MFTVTFQPSGMKIKVAEGTTVLEAANEAGIGIDAPCGGKGTCGKCKVYFNKGKLGPITAAERKNLSIEEIENGCRLACRATILDSSTIDVPEESLLGEQKILIEGTDSEIKVDPFVKVYSIVLPTPTLDDNRCDWYRMESEIAKVSEYKNIDMDLSMLRQIPNLIRDNDYDLSVTMFKNRVMDISRRNNNRLYGAAVDIGTTTMVAYVMDMVSGEIVGIGSMMNPQIPYGDDLMARISYSFQQERLEKLQKVVVDGVNKIIAEGCEKAGITLNDVKEVTIVGNTAMHHIFMGIYPKYLSLAPYCPAVQQAVDYRPNDIGLNIDPMGNCHILPVVAGFVGADHMAVILSCDIQNRDEMTLAIDVGTNGEIVLGNKDGMVCCSAAAGPALEGSCITYGMRAADGAIERVKMRKGNLKLEYKTINNSKPLGICGSGIIDLVAEMLKTAAIDVTGRIREELE
nr:ASKHA domain-containing protein [Candidatus Methanofastidiosa archaeon]